MHRAEVIERLKAERAAAAGAYERERVAEIDAQIAQLEGKASPTDPRRETTAARPKTNRSKRVVRK